MILAASWNDFVAQFWETLIYLISPGVVKGFLPVLGALLGMLGFVLLVWLAVTMAVATDTVARRINGAGGSGRTG